MADDDEFRRDSVQSWKPPPIEDFRNVQFDFTVPSYDVSDYEIEEIEDVVIDDIPDVVPPPSFSNPPDLSNLRLSQLGLTDIPDMEDIPDVSEPNLDFNYDFALPDFSVPPETSAADAKDTPSSSSATSKKSSASKKSSKSSKNKKKKGKPKTPAMEETVAEEENNDYANLMDQWQNAAEGNPIEEEKSSKDEAEEPASLFDSIPVTKPKAVDKEASISGPSVAADKKGSDDKPDSKSDPKATSDPLPKTTTPQKDASVFHPLPASSIFRPLPTATAPKKDPPVFDMSKSLDKASMDDEEPKLAAKALLEEHLKEPLEEIESFPRRRKNPKKPKRDQEDIPKTLITAGTKAQRPSLKQEVVEEGTPAPRPLIVEEGGADVATLLFEGVASLEQPEVEESLEELGQAFLKSDKKCAEALDLGGHGIVVVTMKKWCDNAKIQQLGCECLHNIIYNYKQSQQRLDIFEALAVMGAMETVINGMDKFPEVLFVQRSGLAALGNLLYGKNERLKQRTRKAVEELDFITTVVGGMRRFPKDAIVQGCGCIVLATLFKVCSDYKSKMTEAGVLLDVAAAVTNNPKNAQIEKEASAFMKLFFDWQGI